MNSEQHRMCSPRARLAATRAPFPRSRPGRRTPAACSRSARAWWGPDPRPPLHVHEDADECFYVVEGRLLVQVGEERHELGPGGFAWLPRQVPHTFANVSARPVRLLGIAVPGGIEELFAEQSAYFAQLQGPPDPGGSPPSARHARRARRSARRWSGGAAAANSP